MKISTKVIIKSVLFVALLTVGNLLHAQDDEGTPLTISGSVDTYFRTNINGVNTLDVDVDGDGTIDETLIQSPASSFANQPGFALGMANLVIGMDGEKSGFVADLVFGPRGTDAVFASTTASSSIVNQLYAYLNVSDNVTLTVGNFNTFLGYEVISPTGNFNYSTSYMFSYGPFSHSGLKADITLGDDASLMLGVLNPTDFTDFNPDGTYYGGVQLGISGQYLNVLFGGEDVEYFQVDYTGGFDASEDTYIGINATYNQDLFNGAALYLQQSFSDDFSLGLRGEYFGDEGVGIIGTGESIIDLTLSANITAGDLTIIPEVRLDSYSVDDVVITDWDPLNPTAASTANSLSSFVLAAVYAF